MLGTNHHPNETEGYSAHCMAARADWSCHVTVRFDQAAGGCCWHIAAAAASHGVPDSARTLHQQEAVAWIAPQAMQSAQPRPLVLVSAQMHSGPAGTDQLQKAQARPKSTGKTTHLLQTKQACAPRASSQHKHTDSSAHCSAVGCDTADNATRPNDASSTKPVSQSHALMQCVQPSTPPSS